MSACRKYLSCVLGVLRLAVFAAAEGLPAAPTLQHLAQKSGLIFAGTVLAVSRSEGQEGAAIATLQVTLRVDDAIRGVRAGQAISFRQLAGVQEAGERYRAGERVLLFLYPVSKLGLTTPVEGAFGRFELDGDGRVLLQQARVSTLSYDPVLRMPLRSVGPQRTAAVSGRLFRRAILHSAESQR